MSLFNDREAAFEKQFAHDQDLRFKATARRNKLMGLWVAERLGKTGP
ncbi:MAG: ATPase inhibitor subunit zeta, partial [Microvirga sp.]